MDHIVSEISYVMLCYIQHTPAVIRSYRPLRSVGGLA